jgi:dihydrofolate reductase
MTSLILKMSISLDGYVAPADRSSDWEAAARSHDGAEWVLDTVSRAGAHLVGAVTYERWAGSWPGASGPFAAPMNEIPKVVFSNSLTCMGIAWGASRSFGRNMRAAGRSTTDSDGGNRWRLGNVVVLGWLRLVVEARHPFQPAGQVPVPIAEQLHRCR